MTYRSSSSLAGTSTTSAAIPVPTGAAIGDIAVVGLYMESAASVTPPSGFTLKVSLQTSVASRGRLDVFWKRLTAADTGTYSFSWTGATWRAGVCGMWSGRVATGDPFDATGTNESTTGVTTLNVSASPTGSLGDALGIWTNFSTSTSFTPPTNYTERIDIPEMTLDTRDAIASGSTGNITSTAVTTDFEKAFLGVLAVASSGLTGTASLAGTATITAAGTVSATASLASTATVATTGSVVWTGSATRATTATFAATGATGLATGASLASTAGLSAAGSSGASPALTVTAAITAAG